jgi:rhodanese-related sulfurtransferase
MSAQSQIPTEVPYRRNLLQAGFLIGLAALMASISALTGLSLEPSAPDTPYPRISVEELLEQPGPLLLVDARSAFSYQQGHIPDAILIDTLDYEAGLERFLEYWTPDHTVVVYCSSLTCGKSEAVASALAADLGVSGILILEGGWDAWTQHQQQP